MIGGGVMDKSEVKRILDGLDQRLALGEIDLGTYKSLKSKFTSQLEEPKQEPLDSVVAAMSREVMALKCPGCMAPLPLPSDKAQMRIVCEYCGGTFALQTASDEMGRLRDDVRKWINETAMQAGIDSAADSIARASIFKKDIYPKLKLTVDRATELYQATRYMPIFAFPLILNLKSSPFRDALLLTPDMSSLVDRLKAVVAQIEAPELAPFAVGDLERSNLNMLKVNCMELVYLSNFRLGLADSTTDGFERARANSRALNELYSASSKMSATQNVSYGNFMKCMEARISAIDKTTEILAELMVSSEGIMADRIVTELESAARSCENAALNIEISGLEPKEVVPAAEGSRNDAQVIQMFADCVRIYSQCAAESGVYFGDFQVALGEAVDKAQAPGSNVDWMKGFLSNLARYLGAMAGEIEFPLLKDFSWVETSAIAGVRSSLFGGKESHEVKDQLLLPLWAAKISFSKQKGSWILKKGESAQGLLFIEAARHNGFSFVEWGDGYLAKQCYDAFASPDSLGQFEQVVAPTVDKETARRGMKAFIDSSDQYRGGLFEMMGIIYLPAAIVHYKTRKAERSEVLLPGTERHSISLGISQLQLGTRKLLLAN